VNALTERVDLLVIGGGIIGLAVADAAVRRSPWLAVAVLEKESQPARHQTGRNSGVIHAGLYYRPGSAKATMVSAGRRRLMEFCDSHGIPYDVCGKVVVATDRSEVGRLAALAERADANGVAVTRLGPAGLHDIEPHAQGVEALHIPSTGIVNFEHVCRALVADVAAAGASVRFGARVERCRVDAHGVRVETTTGDIEARWAVNCGGLHADRIARQVGAESQGVRIVPFRGEYFELVAERRHLVRHLVYPVPDPRFPFLGVHFTRSTDGGVHAGPNAVLALAREGYDWRQVESTELVELATFPGVRRLARRHWRTGLGEVHRSLSRRAFTRALQRLIPDVRDDDLVRAPAGVRAQAVASDGSLLDDFAFAESERFLHVLNAPSPAATAALNIGDTIASRVLPLVG
jgi:L-2-hydroxyglutarate oxidase